MKEWGFWKRLTFTIVQQCDRENRYPRLYLWAPNPILDGSGFDSCRISLHHAEATLWVDLVQECVREPLLRFPVKKIQNNLIAVVIKYRRHKIIWQNFDSSVVVSFKSISHFLVFNLLVFDLKTMYWGLVKSSYDG